MDVLITGEKWAVGYGHPTHEDFYAYVPAGTCFSAIRPTIETFDNEADARDKILEIDPDYQFDPPME